MQKQNLLNKSDMYNFYKSEYEECNKNYQNILHEFDNINTNNLIKHKILNKLPAAFIASVLTL